MIDQAALAALCDPRTAVDALREALRTGVDPASAPPRTSVPLSAGELLLMPAEHGAHAGVKITGVAPGNPDRGLPRVTGLYLLLDATTLRPAALLDGAELTLLRTSAVSALAVDCLAPRGADRLLVYGTGPQALAHAEAVNAVRPLLSVEVAGRRPERVAALVDECRRRGLPAAVATERSLAEADVVACCTSAHEPLFDGERLADNATVIAMGSHTPDARETDDATVRRSTVVVEDVATALREAGDVVLPHAAGLLPVASLVTLADVVSGRHEPDTARPRFFKSVGMAWQDLAVAERVFALAGEDEERDRAERE
ncbi:ornithine cyclodeaminase family protein [Streptomyces tsukubensis]|uniref:Ornithine cyclodeaminase n=2 Tax=Streptomyces tsukubensis TaxID=83656 RepID=A0A1V4AH89_9ACTN|nr:hypothetical protein B1H18_02365 [Streptomyces tsukubensis]QFR97437.1 ornithine cyclodeaminase family protein [Streptomyces tsukubensis]